MSSAASARQPGQQGQQGGAQGQSEAQRAAERLKQAGQTLQSMRQQQTGSEMGDLANKAEQLAGQQQDFEQRLRRNFGQGQGNQQTAQQMADEKQKMLDAYNQLQKADAAGGARYRRHAAGGLEGSARRHGQEPAGEIGDAHGVHRGSAAAGLGPVRGDAGSAGDAVVERTARTS